MHYQFLLIFMGGGFKRGMNGSTVGNILARLVALFSIFSAAFYKKGLSVFFSKKRFKHMVRKSLKRSIHCLFKMGLSLFLTKLQILPKWRKKKNVTPLSSKQRTIRQF